MIKTAYDFEQLEASEQKDLFVRWNAPTIARLLNTASKTSAIRKMADKAGWVKMTPPAHAEGWEWDDDRKMHIDPRPEVVPIQPLRDRIRQKEEGIDPAILAAFRFADVSYWLERDRPDIARIIVEQTDVKGQPRPVQDAKASVLAEFDL